VICSCFATKYLPSPTRIAVTMPVLRRFPGACACAASSRARVPGMADYSCDTAASTFERPPTNASCPVSLCTIVDLAAATHGPSSVSTCADTANRRRYAVAPPSEDTPGTTCGKIDNAWPCATPATRPRIVGRCSGFIEEATTTATVPTGVSAPGFSSRLRRDENLKA